MTLVAGLGIVASSVALAHVNVGVNIGVPGDYECLWRETRSSWTPGFAIALVPPAASEIPLANGRRSSSRTSHCDPHQAITKTAHADAGGRAFRRAIRG